MIKITIQPMFNYMYFLKSIFSNNSNNDLMLFKSGRHSLDHAINEIRSTAKKYENILVPKLVCSEIIPYINKHDINITYYNINDDLSIDGNDLLNKMSTKPSIILIINFFGFLADWDKINNLLKSKDCIIIEDNAHSYLDDSTSNLNGDYTFNSYRKILPVLSGSMLRKRNNKLHNSCSHTRTPSYSEIIYSLRQIKSYFTNRSYKNKKIELNIESNNKIDFISNTLLRGYNFDKSSITDIRQKNYAFWKDYLADKDIVFFSNLEVTKNTCPYVFPCYVKNKTDVALWKVWGEKKGINIISWPDFPLIIENDMQSSNLSKIILFPVNHQFDLNKRIG